MYNYTIYDTITGEIKRTYSAIDDDSIFYNLIGNEGFIEGLCDQDTQMIDIIDKKIITRLEGPSLIDKIEISSNGVDFITISNLVEETIEVQHIYDNIVQQEPSIPGVSNGRNLIILENPINNQFEFKTNTPGTYEIKIIGFPYLPKTFTVTAT